MVVASKGPVAPNWSGYGVDAYIEEHHPKLHMTKVCVSVTVCLLLTHALAHARVCT